MIVPSDAPREILRRRFGFSEFRPHQEEIIRSTLQGRDVFAALPTGGGKSLCYQLPALVDLGLTVVVSPLIALMEDQVLAAEQNGIAAGYLNSSMDEVGRRSMWRRLYAGEMDLLYVSPERLANPDFRQHLREWGLSRVAVDEAHCISEWGHEFRQDYRSLSTLRSEFPEVPIAAFTATATREVQEDVVTQLRLREPLVVRSSFDRPEITYRVTPRTQEKEQILSFVRSHGGEPGIVYRGTRKAVEHTAAMLNAAGFPAVAYHAGLTADQRRTRQSEFVDDQVLIVVATIAFGMGIDKSNVRWVLHGDLPKSLEAYYQETGRAGRDGEPAEALLLHGGGDIATHRWHMQRMEQAVERQRAEHNLREVLAYVDGTGCRRQRLLAHFNEKHPGDCGGCDVCLGEISLEDATVPAQKLLSAAVRTGERFGAHHLVDIVVGRDTERVQQFDHHLLPTFGVGADKPRAWWLSFSRELEHGGYWERQSLPGQRGGGGFRLTSAGRLVLSGKQTVVVAAHRGESSGSQDHRAGDRNPTEDAGAPHMREDQLRLFECLRKLRLALARQRSVPPYVVFSDRTLKVVARNRPTDRQALLRCHGIGEAKLEQYGPAVLKTVEKFLATGTCETLEH